MAISQARLDTAPRLGFTGGPPGSRSRHLGIKSARNSVSGGCTVSQDVLLLQVEGRETTASRDVLLRSEASCNRIVGMKVGNFGASQDPKWAPRCHCATSLDVGLVPCVSVENITSYRLWSSPRSSLPLRSMISHASLADATL